MRLVDNWGNAQHVRKVGRMNLVKHTTILSALERRALRYRRDVHNKLDGDELLYREAMETDETETVATEPLSESDDDVLISGDTRTKERNSRG